MSDLVSGGAFIDTPPLAPPILGPDRIGVLRAAGYNNNEIAGWASRARGVLSQAGYPAPEIDTYLGETPRPLAPLFFDRLVAGAGMQPAGQPDLLSEVYRGVMRSGTSLVYSIEDLANKIETAFGSATGSEAVQATAASDVAALKQRKAESASAYAPGVGSIGDVGGASDAAHYVIGKVGELIPTVGEYLALGVPRMVLLGALGGALRAAEQNNGDAKATAAGAAIGAVAAGAPAPFIAGAVGKGLIENVARGAAGMAAANVAQTFAEPIPKMLAGGEYETPSAGQIAESAASGVIAGALFGGVGGLRKHERSPTGEPQEVAVGSVPEAGAFRDAATVIAGPEVAPTVSPKLQQLYDDKGIHPAEVAHDAARDVTISQDLLSDRSYIRAYHGSPHNFNKFEISEVGTGEGAQAYGYGIYLAENQNVAGQYRQKLGNNQLGALHDLLPEYFRPGNIVPSYGGRDRVLEFHDNGDFSWQAKVQGIDTKGEPVGQPRIHSTIPSEAQFQQVLGRGPGHLYEVRFRASPDALIDWDRPLSEQPKIVEKLKSAGIPTGDLSRSGGVFYDDILHNDTGIDRKTGKSDAAALSQRFHDAGIAGIRYFDRSSRKAGEGTRNFVVFNPRDTEIVSRDGTLLTNPITPTIKQTNQGPQLVAPGDEPPINAPQPGTSPVGMSLGAPPPPRTSSEQAVLNRLSIGETDSGRPWSWSRFYTAIVDRLNPINEAVQQAGSPTKAADDAYKLSRLYAGVSGKAEQWIKHGTFDFASQSDTGKSLQQIITPFAHDLDGFRAYITSLRAIELEKQGIETGFSPADLQEAHNVVRDGYGKYASSAAELVRYQNKLIAYLRDSGVISRDSYNAMTQKHQFYVPFQRVFGDKVGDIIPDAIRGPGISLQASNPLHEIVGSQRRVIDPLESVIHNTYMTIAMAEKNAAMTRLVDTLNAAGGPKITRNADTISIFRNGAKEEHNVDADLAAAVKGLDEESVNTALRLIGVPARMLRAGATLTPDFMARNVIRDFFGAVVNTTKGGIFSPIDTAKGLMSAIHKNADYQAWLKGGGANATMVSLDRRYLQQDIAKLSQDTGLGTRAWNVVKHPIETLRTLSELSEQATRLGEFKSARARALASGMTEKEANIEGAYASREVTLDFARWGSQTRAMNMITAFWNAQVQGVDRLARAFRDNPIGTTSKVFMGITLPSILLWMNNHNDPRWQEIPGWERDLFWIIMTKDHIYRIPKPFEAGIVFGSGIERMLDSLFTENPQAFRGFANSVFEALSPGAIPTVALPVIEQFANRSTFADRSLIPANVEKLLPEYEYTPYTTELTKALGQTIGAFPGIREARLSSQPVAGGVARALSTPILMENYIRGWTGGLGMYALQLADKGLRDQGILPDPPKPADTLSDIPFVKAFTVRYPTASSESVQRFYDDYETRKRYLDTWKAKAKEGDIAAMRHIHDMGGQSMFVQLDQIKNTLSTQSKFVRDIYKNPSISPEKKRELIDTAYMRMTEVARHGTDIMRKTDSMPVH